MKHTLLGLFHIPLDDIGLRNADILGQLNGSLSTAPKLHLISTMRRPQLFGSTLTAPMTSTLGDLPDTLLPPSNDSFTDSINRSWFA
jgi:hypothetical protein